MYNKLIVVPFNITELKALAEEINRRGINIFISYSWAHKETVNNIDEHFQSIGLNLIMDTKDIEDYGSITEFMKRVRTTDFIIMVISEEYLQSADCMYQVLECLKDEDFQQRVIPVVLPDTDVFKPGADLKYLQYWEQKSAEIKAETECLNPSYLTETAKDLQKIEFIKLNIGDFLKKLEDIKMVSLADLEKSGYKQILERILQISSQREDKLINVPPQNPNFIDRRKELAALYTQLKEQGLTAVTQVSYAKPIVGLGGIGKTQLALRYIYEHQKEYSFIGWIDAGQGLAQGYKNIARALKLNTTDKNEDEIIELVKQHLNRKKGWLLIFDNVEDESVLYNKCPVGGKLLVTSRSQQWGNFIDVEVLERKESIKLLKNTIAREGLIDGDLAKLAKVLGDLPLALVQAGAYIGIDDNPLQAVKDYLILIQDIRPELLDSEAPKDHKASVWATYTIAREKIKEESPLAAKILTLAGYLSPEEIPDALLDNFIKPELQGKKAELIRHERKKAVKLLRKYSMVSLDNRIHNLVQAVIQDQEKEAGLEKEHIKAVLLAITTLFEEIEEADSQTKDKWIPHGKAILEYARHCEVEIYVVAKLAFTLAENQFEKVFYQSAKELYETALDLFRKHHGTDYHTDVAKTLNSLGIVAFEQGDFNAAKDYFSHAVITYKEIYGTVIHIDIAIIFNRMGAIGREQGNLMLAKRCYDQALRIYNQIYDGVDYHTGALILNSLGIIAYDQGELQRAEYYFSQALGIYKKVYGTDIHPDVAMNLYNLGNVAKDQRDWITAKDYYEQALKIRREVYSTDIHPDVAGVFDNLGYLASNQGDWITAKEHYEQALAIYREVHGTDVHPDVAMSLYNLGNVAFRQDELNVAKGYYEQALAIYREIHGKDNHYTVSDTLNNLGNVVYGQGELDIAKNYYEQALNIKKQIFGNDKPLKIVMTLNNLGNIAYDQGDWITAKNYYEQVLQIFKEFNYSSNYITIIQQKNDQIVKLLNQK